MLDPPRMSPRHGALAACALPDLPTPGDLAAWLDVTVTELDWFADVHGMNASDGPLCHYRYTWVPKSHGMRLMEAPKIRLREIQRKILRGILDRVPPHAAAHGFRRGKSCRTYVESHVGREVVLRMDLRDFFPSIPAPRIHALFDTLGYPQAVARTLTALCTNAVPMSIARRGRSSWLDAKRLGVPHLPQGAPTSPALANLCALHLDLRLDELAKSMEGQYTRYADDLAISGDETLRRTIGNVATLITQIAIEEGFDVNHRKTRPMFRSNRQLLTGVVVNDKPNVRRQDFDRLKAVLTNCARHGPASQNRDEVRDFQAHLSGRIAHVASLNGQRGRKLQQIFHRIDWAG
jgi:retron-type reverse transcriptase